MLDDTSALEQIRVVAGLAKTLISLGREAKSKGLDEAHAERLNNAIIDMQAAVLDAQSDALMAQEVQSRQATKIRELEQTVAEYDNWEKEKARYELVEAGRNGGVLVYQLRQEAAEGGEPLHYICPRCYNHKVKSFLQRDRINGIMQRVCPECESIYRLT